MLASWVSFNLSHGAALFPRPSSPPRNSPLSHEFITGKFPGNVEEMLACVSYLPLSGDGGALGDGIIPREVAVLEGSTMIDLPTSKHSGALFEI